MRIILEHSMDLGTTLDIDPKKTLSEKNIQKIKDISSHHFGSAITYIANPIVDHEGDVSFIESVPFGVRLPYGSGFRLCITSGPLIERWKASAHDFFCKYPHDLIQSDKAAIFQTGEAICQTTVNEVDIIIFGVGFCHIIIDLAVQDGSNSMMIKAVDKSFEYAGYGGYNYDLPDSPNALLAQWRNELSTKVPGVFSKESMLDRLKSDPQIKFLGFDTMIVSNAEISSELIEVFDIGDAISRIKYKEINIIYHPSVTFIESFNKAYEHRLRFVRMTCFISNEICQTYEEISGRLVIDSLSNDLRATKQLYRNTHRQRLKRLRKLISLILYMTDNETMSEWTGDIEVIRKIDHSTRVGLRRHRMELAQNRFSESELDDIRDSEQRRGANLNRFVLFLTAVSMVGVMAAVISAWSLGLDLIGSLYMLAMVLISPSLLLIAVVLLFIRLFR